MRSIDVLIKSHNLVTIGDVTEHILPSNLVEESLFNYSIFFKL